MWVLILLALEHEPADLHDDFPWFVHKISAPHYTGLHHPCRPTSQTKLQNPAIGTMYNCFNMPCLRQSHYSILSSEAELSGVNRVVLGRTAKSQLLSMHHPIPHRYHVEPNMKDTDLVESASLSAHNNARSSMQV